MKGKSVFNWNMKDVNGFEPVVDGQSEVLVLGTAPGAQSLLTGEYYANRGNIFWEIISHIFNGGRPFASYAEKVACLHQNHIALWDTLSRCRREGSTDDNITAEEHNDIDRFLAEHPSIKKIVFNGKAPSRYYKPAIDYAVALSTSPANRKFSFDERVQSWAEAMGL